MGAFPAPSPPFIAARHRGGRQTPKGIVIHGTVSPDNPGTARKIALWWKGTTSPVTSAHYIVDPREVIQSVGDHTIAFHCGYNTGTIAVELCDEQTGSARRWDDADSRAILARAATLVAQLCLAYGIATARPSVAELRRRGPHGIYGHNDSRLAFGHTSHTDPRDFPWERFMSMVRSEVARLRTKATNQQKEVRAMQNVSILHTSMQFSDNDRQHRQDVDTIFSAGDAIITGTESGAGSGQLPAHIRAAAKRYGYRLAIFKRTSTWVAVKRSLAVGRIAKGYVPVIPSSGKIGDPHQHGERGIVWLAFDTPNMGRITVAAVHYLTKGRTPKQTRPGRVNHYALNRAYARAIARWVRKAGAGSALAFVNGDMNTIDRTTDVFYGGPLTTCWDELRKWPDTGHGNIDVIASYDGDARVRCLTARALGDIAMPLHTDHYAIRAVYQIKEVAR